MTGETERESAANMYRCEHCHRGYIVISHVRPTVYCQCLQGTAARAMDDDPLDNVKAHRWERVVQQFRPKVDR